MDYRNPPAFPRDHRHLGHSGMSMRDYYAGQALIEFASLVTVTQDRTFDVVAGLCYKMADAMLAQRMKDTDNG